MKNKLEPLLILESYGNLVPKGMETINSFLEALSYVGTAEKFQNAQAELTSHMTDATKSLEEMMKPAWDAGASLAERTDPRHRDAPIRKPPASAAIHLTVGQHRQKPG